MLIAEKSMTHNFYFFIFKSILIKIYNSKLKPDLE